MSQAPHERQEGREPPDRRGAGLTGIFGRVVAVMMALFAGLVGGVLRALVEGFARALGARPAAPPAPPDDDADAEGTRR